MAWLYRMQSECTVLDALFAWRAADTQPPASRVRGDGGLASTSILKSNTRAQTMLLSDVHSVLRLRLLSFAGGYWCGQRSLVA